MFPIIIPFLTTAECGGGRLTVMERIGLGFLLVMVCFGAWYGLPLPGGPGDSMTWWVMHILGGLVGGFAWTIMFIAWMIIDMIVTGEF